MNEILQKLAQFAPALIGQIKGNPEALSAFMQGYQETLAQKQQRGDRERQMTMQGEDRQRGIERQGRLDDEHAADRTRQKTLAGQQDVMRELEIVPQLAQAGAQAETPQDAQSLIESLMPRLMEGFGQGAMAYGQPAVEMATRTITGRQKKAVEAYVDAALKTSFVADNPDSDPELVQLPEHIAKIVGKPAARLSELQQFAQLPVGKPQGKTRIPPAAGSMEEFSDPATTPERKTQIAADRKVYMQADDRAPRVTVNTGGVDSKAMARFNAIAGAYDRSPLIKAADRTLILDDAAKTIRKDPKNAAAQMALAYGYIQALDTYQSAVREGELGNLGSLGTVWQQLGVSANKLITTGAFMPPEVALQIANSADQLVQVIEKGRQQKMGEFASRAKVNKVDDMWSEFVGGMPSRGGAAPPAAGGQITVTSPSGKSYTFTTQADADAAVKKAQAAGLWK